MNVLDTFSCFANLSFEGALVAGDDVVALHRHVAQRAEHRGAVARVRGISGASAHNYFFKKCYQRSSDASAERFA